MMDLVAMQVMPIIPSWSELHPLVIHFPIALLLVAPLFILAGVLMKGGKGRPFLIAAFFLMLLGTAGTYLAVETGEAAAEIADRTPVMSAVLEHHEDLAQTTRIIFTALSILFAILLFLPRVVKREASPAVNRVLPLAFLLFYAGGAAVLVNTAHNGGRLVHEFGIHAGLAQTNPTAPGVEANETAGQEAEEKR